MRWLTTNLDFSRDSAETAYKYFSLEREREAWLAVVGDAFR